MTDIIFSFDTEDFTSNYAADAIYQEAEIMRQAGITAGFCTVGLLAKQLKNWGRTDVVEALRHHQILSHSYGHSLHPTINEYTDREDFFAAYDEAMRQESEALELLRDTFGDVKIYGACPPGNSKSYVAMYAYADLGLPLYADTVCDTPTGTGAFYCNIFHVQYCLAFEQMFRMTDEEIRAALDKLATRKRAIIYTHPNIALYEKHWDAVNYMKVNSHPFGQWEEPPRRSPEEVARFFETMRKVVGWIKADPRFRIISYSQLAEKVEQEAPRVITREEIPALRAAIDKEFAPVTTPHSYSLADLFLAAKDLLLGKESHLCGKVYGFLQTPFAISAPVRLKKEDILASANTFSVEKFLPTEILVGEQKIGPGDWLRAALAVLCGEDEILLTPAPQMPSLDPLPDARDCRLLGWVHSDEYKDEYLSDRLRLQAWTMRFAPEI